jgi:hypothetical protein
VLKTTGHVLLNELAAKAFFQWRFRPGGPTQVQVSCEFYAHGFRAICINPSFDDKLRLDETAEEVD